jgi:hypothetical protein
MKPLRSTLLILVLALALPAGRIDAQQIDLQLREEGSLAPVAGALVRLLGDSGAVTQALTNAQGRITLRAPVPGTYRVRIDRIGWVGMTTPAFDLAAGETRRTELILISTRLELPGLEVRVESRCGGRTEEGTLATALWSEIEKALTASVITQDGGALPLLVREFRRELTRDARVEREYVIHTALIRGRPYVTLPPATLARAGFVVIDQRDSVSYAAPDAHLLLSDEFVSTHCFRAVEGDEGLVGLAFEPVPGRRVIDVSGTLWVDREAQELRLLEFTYTNLPKLLETAGLGGRVEYSRLVSGEWIVRYWHIRTPVLELRDRRGGSGVQTQIRGRGTTVDANPPVLAGLLDLGGRVQAAPDGAHRAERAVVTGVIFDSTTMRGLSDAVVAFSDAMTASSSDLDGHFHLAAEQGGVRDLVATHPKLLLAGEPARRAVVLSLGDTTRVAFAVPSPTTLGRARCGRKQDRTGVVGLTLDAQGVAAVGQEVVAEWSTTTGASRRARTRSGRDGVFVFCELPPDQRILIRGAGVQGQPPATAAIETSFGGFQWVEFRTGAR